MTNRDAELYRMVTGALLQRRLGAETQQAFAHRTGISASALSRYVNGQTAPDLISLRQIAIGLRTTSGELLADVESAFERANELAAKTGRSNVLGLALLAVSAPTPR